MGAFMVFDIRFATKNDRKKFERFYQLGKKDILVDEHSNSHGFRAWTCLRNPELDIVYYFGFIGYAEPEEMVRECKEQKINIKFMAYIPINDRRAEWTKIKGRWP